MKLLRRFVLLGFGTVAVGLSYFAFNLITAESRVRAVCESIKPGMNVTQLREIAQANGLAPLRFGESGISYAVEKKTYGRFGCKLVLDAGIVKQAEFHFAD